MDGVSLETLRRVVGSADSSSAFSAVRVAFSQAGPVEESSLPESATTLLRSRALGVSLMLQDGVVRSAQLHFHGRRGMAVFGGELPLGVDPAWPLGALVDHLGSPDSGEGGAYEQWVAYRDGELRVVFSYGKRGLRRVTMDSTN